MKYLTIKRKDGSVNTVRYECESATEKSLTYEEEIIKELYHKIAELEQELAKLKKSQTQKSIIKLCERVDKAEQQVEGLKKELQANNMFINEKIKNYNSGYEKLVDIKIGSQHVTKK